MAGVIPSPVGGANPYSLAQAYNNTQVGANVALNAAASKANIARSVATSADTSALADLQVANTNNAAELLPILGPLGIGLMTGQLARAQIGNGDPQLVTDDTSRYVEQAGRQRDADVQLTQGQAANEFFAAGMRPGDLAKSGGGQPGSVPFTEAFNTRYGDQSGVMVELGSFQGDTFVPDPNATGPVLMDAVAASQYAVGNKGRIIKSNTVPSQAPVTSGPPAAQAPGIPPQAQVATPQASALSSGGVPTAPPQVAQPPPIAGTVLDASAMVDEVSKMLPDEQFRVGVNGSPEWLNPQSGQWEPKDPQKFRNTIDSIRRKQGLQSTEDIPGLS